MNNKHLIDLPLKKRLKEYVNNQSLYINKEEYILFTFNIKNYEKLEKMFKSPFDIKLYNILLETFKLVSQRFQFNSIYVSNHNIIGVISPKEDKEHFYNGNINKYLSNLSSITTLIYNQCLNEYIINLQNKIDSSHFKIISLQEIEYVKLIREKLFEIYFEVEIFSIDSSKEVLNSFIYSSKNNDFQNKKNFLNMHLNEVDYKNINEEIKRCVEEVGYDYQEYDNKYKFGTLIKKDKIYSLKEVIDFNIYNKDLITS